VEMKMKDGRLLSQHVDYPKGEPGNPFSDQDHIDKFNGMASHVGMNQAQKSELLKRLDRFEELDNVSELTALLVP
jgi:2-methylcitrate dehydratase PrpD